MRMLDIHLLTLTLAASLGCYTKSASYLQAISNKSHLPTRCTHAPIRLDGSSRRNSRKRSASTWKLSSWVFGMSLSRLRVILSLIIHQTSSNFYRDTVDSVGLIPKRLPFTTSNTIVRTFRHAVSLDERRAKFKANLWNRPRAGEAKYGSKSTTTMRAPTSLGAAGGSAQVHQQTTSFDDYPNNSYSNVNLKDFILKQGQWNSPCLPYSSTNNMKSGDAKENGDNPKDGNKNSNLLDHSHSQKGRKKEAVGHRDLNTLERMYSEKGEKMTDVDEVWFAVRVIYLFFP